MSTSIYIYIYLYLHLFPNLYLHPSISKSISAFIHVYIYLNLFMSVSIYIYRYFYIYICSYLHLSISISIFKSISIFIYIHLYLQIYFYMLKEKNRSTSGVKLCSARGSYPWAHREPPHRGIWWPALQSLHSEIWIGISSQSSLSVSDCPWNWSDTRLSLVQQVPSTCDCEWENSQKGDAMFIDGWGAVAHSDPPCERADRCSTYMPVAQPVFRL